MNKLLHSFGDQTLGFLESWGDMVTLGGRSFGLILTGRNHWRNTLQQLAFIGADSLPIALLISLSVGSVFTLQIANEFIRYGATSAIGGVVGVALARELAPILVSIVIAGRVGAAIAAELGSMKVTEQIDALEVFAVDPNRYLVAPRVFACLASVPVLVALGNVVGILGGYAISTYVKHIPGALFVDSLQSFLAVSDVLRGMFKASIFGVLVAVIGCYQGLNAKKGAQGVGAATTNSVVYGMVAIFVLNYFLSMVLFPGGNP